MVASSGIRSAEAVGDGLQDGGMLEGGIRHHFVGLDAATEQQPPIEWNAAQSEEHLSNLRVALRDNENYILQSDGNIQAIYPLRLDDSTQVVRMSDPSDDPPFPLEQTFLLHSRPGALKTVYLDFTGHTTTGTSWNSSTGVTPIVTPAYSIDGNPDFSSTELERIQRIWERVSEDFLPFDLNVTTQEPPIADLRNTGGGDSRWGIRVVIGANTGWYANVGGVAYLNSFNWSSDTPTFVFNSAEKSVAEAVSHEVGHTLGLSHDGTSTSSYYTGHGTGSTGWAPIMGVGYNRELVQWSKGEYPGATTTQDDLQIITTLNGFTYRTDDHGNGIANATALVVDGTSVYGDGIIERRTDVDCFRFTTTGGNTLLNVNPFYLGPNLDILVTVYNSAGSVIAVNNPVSSLAASFALTLAAGTYYLSVDGTGKAASGSDYGYTDYASLGYYSVSGYVPNANTTVGGSFVYHKGSTFASDGLDNALDPSKFLAKQGADPIPLDYSNLINSSRGINGLVFDMQGLPSSSLSASDFEFQFSPQGAFVEADHPPLQWQAAPNPIAISVIQGTVDRIVLEWPDFSIVNRWLRVTIKANAGTGLLLPQVYYLGHLVGETNGPTNGIYTLSFSDIAPVRAAVGQAVGAGDVHDIDKNGTVTFADISFMREYVGAQLTNITIPADSSESGGGMMLSGSGSSDDNGPNKLTMDGSSAVPFAISPNSIAGIQTSEGSRSGRLDNLRLGNRQDENSQELQSLLRPTRVTFLGSKSDASWDNLDADRFQADSFQADRLRGLDSKVQEDPRDIFENHAREEPQTLSRKEWQTAVDRYLEQL